MQEDAIEQVQAKLKVARRILDDGKLLKNRLASLPEVARSTEADKVTGTETGTASASSSSVLRSGYTSLSSAIASMAAGTGLTMSALGELRRIQKRIGSLSASTSSEDSESSASPAMPSPALSLRLRPPTPPAPAPAQAPAPSKAAGETSLGFTRSETTSTSDQRPNHLLEYVVIEIHAVPNYAMVFVADI
jgi:hypothetical protein